MSTPMEPWELLARECIRDLVTRYNSNGDSGRIAQVLELFTHDATMEITSEGGETRTYRGTDEIEAMLTGAIETFREAADERAQAGYVRHCVTTHQIDVGERQHATGRCYFFVIRANGLDHWGRYVDRYEERDGRWRFTYRKVTTEGHQPGPA
ncbi:MAG: nuclear transport factor 2 family protein [Acidimicrobiales bacterium]